MNGGGGQTRAPYLPELVGSHATGKHFCLPGLEQGAGLVGGWAGEKKRESIRLFFPTCLSSSPLDFSAPSSAGRIVSNVLHSSGQQETRGWWWSGKCFQIRNFSVSAGGHPSLKLAVLLRAKLSSSHHELTRGEKSRSWSSDFECNPHPPSKLFTGHFFFLPIQNENNYAESQGSNRLLLQWWDNVVNVWVFPACPLHPTAGELSGLAFPSAILQEGR